MRLAFPLRLLAASLCALLALSSDARAAEPSVRLKALQESATNLYKAGSYAQALEASKLALAQAIQEFGPDHEQTGIQAYSVAFLAELAGDLPLAERHYAETVRMREVLYGRDSAPVSLALEKLAGVKLKLGKPGEAEPIYERTLKIRTDLLGEHSFSASAYAGLADVRLARRDYAGALPLYRRAITLLTGQDRSQAVVQSIVEGEIKRHRDVFIGLTRAAWGARQQPGANLPALAEETYAAGQLAWATSAASALAKMTARLKAGDTEIGRSMRSLESLSERVLALHDEDMKALADWDRVQKADPVYSRALEAFTKASTDQSRDTAPIVKRQKELVEALQAGLARCPPGQSQDKAGCENSDREREAEEKLPGYAAFNSARSARLAESQRLQTELATRRKEVVGKFPQYVSLTEPSPLSIAETQGLLGPEEALVAMLTGSARTVVWVVTRDRADWAEIEAGEEQLAGQVAALRRGLDPMAISEDRPAASGDSGPALTGGFDIARSHQLYKLLLERFAPLLTGKRHLLLVPTGPLSSLPFQVLVAAPPQPGQTGAAALRSADWLIRRHAMSVLPSVQSLSALRKLAAAGTAVKPFFGMGDPIFGGPDATDPQKRGAKRVAVQPAALYRNGLADIRALRELVPLPETAAELQAVARTLRAPSDAISLREAATESRVKAAALGDYRVVHFATHGLVAGDLDGVNEPALALTPPAVATEADDGLLTASEIATLKLDADWVVLSACNTAAGDKVGADALSGLARAFFFAGARALLVSHWSVYSQAAVQITTRTFANLAVNPRLGRAEAFRRAMMTIIDEGMPPSYWAPFVVVGEGGVAAAKSAR